MEKVSGGACDGFAAGAAMTVSSFGVAMVFLGPVGWGGALIMGAAGMAIANTCHMW
ncbi:MAG: hypothetical protein AAGA02_00940 [Bacteroidota bacterium]